jgi:hypothetical protein
MQTFRYSAIDTAHSCLTRYKLQYVDKIPAHADGVDSIDLKFGTALHAGIAACLEGDDGEQTFKVFWDSLKGKPFVESRFNWQALGDMGPKFLARFSRLHAKHFSPVAIEQHMRGSIGTHAFEGTPDFVGSYKGTPSIVDFKTSGRAYPKEKILVNEQMPLYAALAAQNLDFKAEQLVYYVFIKQEMRIQVVTAALTEKLLDSAIQNVIITADDLKSRKVFPKNPNSCVMGSWRCPYFEKCHGDANAKE